jgi:DNA-binding CsgD family transcriptional regulator
MNKEFYSKILFEDSFLDASISIAGRVLLKTSQYLIVCNDNIQEDTLDIIHNKLDAVIVGNLVVEGRSYYLIKARNLAKAEESNLVNLLTERELQITTLTALGRSNKQIAHHLHISDCTVSAHLRRIFIKLNVDNRAAMVYRCAALIDQLQQLDSRFCQAD